MAPPPVEFSAQDWELQMGTHYFMKIGGFVNPYSQNSKIAVFQGFTQNLPVALRHREQPIGRIAFQASDGASKGGDWDR